MDFWLYPGALVSVNGPTKVTMISASPGEYPPPGATVIPPQSSLPPSVAIARMAEQAIAEQGEETKRAVAAATSHAPWEVTFQEKLA